MAKSGFFFVHFQKNSAPQKLIKFQNSANFFSENSGYLTKTQFSGNKKSNFKENLLHKNTKKCAICIFWKSKSQNFSKLRPKFHQNSSQFHQNSIFRQLQLLLLPKKCTKKAWNKLPAYFMKSGTTTYVQNTYQSYKSLKINLRFGFILIFYPVTIPDFKHKAARLSRELSDFTSTHSKYNSTSDAWGWTQQN